MATAKEALSIAAGELGHVGGAKYWAAMGYGSGYYSQPWCCIFVDWVMQQAGAGIGNYANCLSIQTGLKAAGAAQVSPRQAQAGDILIFEFDRAGDTYDHVGFCEINKDTYLQTIEGNVSNTVGRRTRAYEDVRQCWRPKWAVTDQWVKADGKWSYFGYDGKKVTSAWVKGDGKYAGNWYYLGTDGHPVTDQWKQHDGRWYHLGSDGAAETDEWAEGEGEYADNYYYLGEKGHPIFEGHFL